VGDQLLAAHTNALSGLPYAAWSEMGITAIAPANTDYAQIVFEGNGFGAAGVLGADNFSMDVTAIPEPTSIAMVLLGVLLLRSRLRQRSQ